ncbi:ubiquitin-binding SDF ubiquitin ligase complex subunit met30 [Coemansia spiralis]|uniref:Ubiquitin-binding SDF ubiquitin ligase complex subunit met30 n=1 Tax=Coemansia spiralis TaxID=417178 RepID=A0A9W8KVJ7_9FUNG|nr:ubiquitin-binding SDF ubiquitin ligase complex subunit met30 [Coemansia spiralis]
MSSSTLSPYLPPTTATSEATAAKASMAAGVLGFSAKDMPSARSSNSTSDSEGSHAMHGLLLTRDNSDGHAAYNEPAQDSRREKKAAINSTRKRNYSEYTSDVSPAELEILSLRKYPAFGGRCYRHSARIYLAECDSRQRELQASLQALPSAEQTKISNIWRSFASEPAEQRLLILQGIVNLCCIPQLSYLNKVVPQQLRVDFLAALPPDISLQILSYLDARSLCQATQVSRTWAALANDDILWHRMCAQHIDKVCRKCGWGLPLLDKSSRRVYEATARRAMRLASGAVGSSSYSGAHSSSSASSINIADGTVAGLPDSSYTFVLPMANVAIDQTMSQATHNAAPNRPNGQQMIPISSLMNPLDMDVSLISSVCAPQNAVQFMQQQSAMNSAGMLTNAGITNQHIARLYANDTESGNVSDGSNSAINSYHHSEGSSSSHQTRRRPWKDIFAERQIIANNWRKFRYHESRIQAHADGILCVQFNDEYMITGSYDSKVHVWDAETFELVSELTGHTMPVRALEFDDCKLFSGSLDGTVRIWNYRDGTCIRTLQVFENGGVISLHQQNGTLVVGGENGTIRVYNIAKMTSFTLTGHTDWVNTVRLYGENTLFSCSDDMLVKRWNLEQRRCVRTYTGHSHHVQSLQLSNRMPPSPSIGPVGRDRRGSSLNRTSLGGSSSAPTENSRPFMITGSLDSTMRVWDIETGECLDTVFGHVEGIWSMTFDALRIVSGSNDGTLKVWDTTSHSCLFTLQTTQAAINCVAISDTRIVLGDNDGNARVYDFRNKPSSY